MMRRFGLFALVVAISLSASAQQKTAASKFDKTIMQTVWDAWCTLDPANPAKYYDKNKADIFYDIAPLQYHGWSEYEVGVKPVLAQWKSGKCKVNYDGTVRQESPTMAWTSSTVNLDAVKQDGSPDKMIFRWTAIWHKHGSQWLITHEHVSVPAQ